MEDTQEKKLITQEDLDANPELAEKGLSVGDEFPVEEAAAEEGAASEASAENAEAATE